MTQYDMLESTSSLDEIARTKNTKIRNRYDKCMVVLALIFCCLTGSICASIRLGFLADAFSRRGISGKVYGLVEGSITLGFAATYFTGGVEKAMKRFTNRNILAGTIACWGITSLLTGLVYLIDHDLTVIIASFTIKVLQGVLGYSYGIVPVDFINAQLSTDFDLVYGLVNMGYFAGHGVAEVIGCFLYDRYGYLAPFIFSSGLALIATILILYIIPNSKTFYASQDGTDIPTTEICPSKKLTKLIILPLIATTLINANYGVLQVTVTPYLHEIHNKTISYGGIVLTFTSIGMTIGSFCAGILLQKKVFNYFTIMGMGAFCVCCGLLLIFPSPHIPAIFNVAPITAFFGVTLAGMGDPLITLCTLRALYDLQLHITGQLTPDTVTRLTGIWLMSYASFYYSGSFIAGILSDYLPYSDAAELLSGFCALAVLLCIGMRVFFNNTSKIDEESEPLLNKETCS